MKIYLAILPVAFLVAYSQIVVKWRTTGVESGLSQGVGTLDHLSRYLSDPLIVSAYAAALLASFAWLFVVTKLPLTIAFPVYIGVTFCMVILGGWLFLAEAISVSRIVAVCLILAGIVIGIRE